MRRRLYSRKLFLAGLFLLLPGVGCLGSGTTYSIKGEEDAPAPAVKPGVRSWPMFGGTVHRNLAAPEETGLPDRWSIQEGKTQNIKWSAKLGDKALGGPIVAGGRVFVGTNRPYGADEEEYKGVLICFREADGKFLWQAVHDTLKDGTGAQNYGIVSSPCVEGERVYYVSNRWEVVCADAAGDGGKAKILWKLDMIKDLHVYPGGIAGSLSICSPLIVDNLVFVVTATAQKARARCPRQMPRVLLPWIKTPAK